jgi:hypothetical protein
MTELAWSALTDVDPRLARATREKYVRYVEESGGLAVACHFPGMGARRVAASNRSR